MYFLFLLGLLKDVTGNYTASFVVAGSFLLLAVLIVATLPHFFSRADPPPPQRLPLDGKERGLHPELEQINAANEQNTTQEPDDPAGSKLCH